MSVAYHLTDTTWRPRTLVRFLEAHVGRLRSPLLGEPELVRAGGAVHARLFVEGSVRGALVDMEGRTFRTPSIQVRLGTLASRTDWVLAFDLLRGLLEAGRGVLAGPEGPVESRQLTENEAVTLALRRFADDAESIAKQLLERSRPFAALAGPTYELLVTREDVEAHKGDPMRLATALEDVLARRAARYERALVLPTMQAGDGTPFAFWPLRDALIDAVPYVAVARHAEDEPRVIPGRQLVAALGQGLESVSSEEDRFFLYGHPDTSDFQTAFENAMPYPSWAASHQAPGMS